MTVGYSAGAGFSPHVQSARGPVSLALLSWLLLGPQHAVLAWNPLCLLLLASREAEARTGTPNPGSSGGLTRRFQSLRL